jgi:hypothetical protein
MRMPVHLVRSLRAFKHAFERAGNRQQIKERAFARIAGSRPDDQSQPVRSGPPANRMIMEGSGPLAWWPTIPN